MKIQFCGCSADLTCWKNFEKESCTLDFIKSLVVGKKVSSAGDFGSYIEFGVDQKFNLGLHQKSFHIYLFIKHPDKQSDYG